MKQKKVEIFDIPDELLKYCIRIPEEGLEIKHKFITDSSSTSIVKPVDKNDSKSGYAIKTYSDPYSNKRRTCVTFITATGDTYVTKGDWIMPFLLEAGYTQGRYYDRFYPSEMPKIDNFSLGDACRGYFEEQSSHFFCGQFSFKALREEIAPQIKIIQYGTYDEGILLPTSFISEKDVNVDALGYVTHFGEILCKKIK